MPKKKLTNKINGRPSYQFYPDAWLSDTNLELCSLAAQGLWQRLLCHMFLAKKRGVLRSTPKNTLNTMTAKLGHTTEAEAKQLLNELIDNGVAESPDDRTIYNRRMVRDWKHTQSKVEAGRKGGLKSRLSKTEAKRGSSSPTPTPTPTPNIKYIYKQKKEFEETLKLYPGSKRGLDIEFEYFQKVQKGWREIIPLLKPAIQAQIQNRKKLKANPKNFIPSWKHFKTWIYNSCWTEIAADSADESSQTLMAGETCAFCENPAGSLEIFKDPTNIRGKVGRAVCPDHKPGGAE